MQVAHGCTGKGNDQVRFDCFHHLTLKCSSTGVGMSREETIAYGERFGIPAPVKIFSLQH